MWQPGDMSVAGAVLTLALDGGLRVERGFVRPEDEPKPEPANPAADGDRQDGAEADGTGEGSDSGDAPAGGDGSSTITCGAWPLPVRGGASAVAEPEKEAPALSGALQAELEAHRTAGLQATLAGQPGLALRVMLHALATDAFYARYADTVARFTSYSPNLAAACPGIADSPARQAMVQAEVDWRGRLPEMQPDLWAWLQEQDTPALLGLLAVCVARTADAGRADWTTPHGAGTIHAWVASAAGLDMRQCWTATKEGYLGRVPKALILDAVRDGAGPSAAARIAGTKKQEGGHGRGRRGAASRDRVAAGDAARSGSDISRGLWRGRGPEHGAGGNGGGVTRPVPSLLPDLGRPCRGGLFSSSTPDPGTGRPEERSAGRLGWAGATLGRRRGSAASKGAHPRGRVSLRQW